MTWSVSFRLRRYLRESLWVIPLLAGVLGWILGVAFADVGTTITGSARGLVLAGTTASSLFDLPLAEVTREEGRSLVLVFLATTLGALLSRWSASVGASLIGAGMISVLVYPFVATKLAAAFGVPGARTEPLDETGEY